jgi:hypothetical protein
MESLVDSLQTWAAMYYTNRLIPHKVGAHIEIGSILLRIPGNDRRIGDMGTCQKSRSLYKQQSTVRLWYIALNVSFVRE